MSGRQRVRLSVGPNAAGKIAAAGCAAPFVTVAVLLLLLTARLLAESLAERPIDVLGSLVPHMFVSAVFLVGVYVLGAVTYAMVIRVRYAVFLDGTMLVERIGVRHNRVDLATADVSATYDASRNLVESIVARNPDTGMEVKVLVHKEEHLLPTAELIALADAITSGGTRIGSDDRGSEVADGLRDLASGVRMPAGGSAQASAGRVLDTTRGGSVESGSAVGLPAAVALAVVFMSVLAVIVVLGYVTGYGRQAVWLAVLFGVLGVAALWEKRRKRCR